MQGSGHFDLSTPLAVQKWHPKLTPYRLIALGTTIGVGSAKAIVAQNGESVTSTTLEWISGVVVFLILYTMSIYDESPKDPPSFLRWLFHVDCINYLWRVLSFLRIPCPSYSSEPDLTPRLKDKVHTPILVTPYRLIVCVTILCFGLVKATLTYIGYSSGANWVDWTVGVAIASILFIIGLYENNDVGMWHTFFAADKATETEYGFALLGFTTFYTGWIWLCFGVLEVTLTEKYSRFLFATQGKVLLTELTPLLLLRERLYTACLMLFFTLITVISIGSAYGCVATILRVSELPHWKRVGDAMLGERLPWRNGYMQLQSPDRQLGKQVAFHIICLSIFLLGCTVFLAFWAVCIAANIKECYAFIHSDSEPHEMRLGSYVLAILFQLGGTGATGFLMWLVVWKALLPPLWEWRSGAADWDKALVG